MNIIILIILNTILVSIPEEMFYMIMAMIILGKRNLIDTSIIKYNIGKLLLPVIPSALLSNIIRYVFKSQYSAWGLLPPLLMLILIICICYDKNCNSWKSKILDVLKIFGAFIASMLIGGILELSYMSLYLAVSNRLIIDINSNIFTGNFLMSFPSRIVEYMLIGFIILKYNRGIDIFKTILTKRNAIFIIPFIIINIIIMAYLIKMIGYDRSINLLPNNIKLAIVTLFLCFPTINLYTIFIIIYNTFKKG